MDAIIRYAPVSPFARRIGRPATGAVAAPARVYLASPATPVAAPVSEPDHGAELAIAATRHQAALELRDKELAGLRSAADKAAIELGKVQAAAEARGYAAGEKKGEAAGRAALHAEIERVKSLCKQIEQARRDAIEGSEDALVEIVFAALCRILGEQGASREAIQAVVRQAIDATRSREQLTVRLHPQDAALFIDAAAQGEMRIEGDGSVKLGGCMLDSAAGSLDARFETQLALLAAALKAARAGRQPEQEGCR